MKQRMVGLEEGQMKGGEEYGGKYECESLEGFEFPAIRNRSGAGKRERMFLTIIDFPYLLSLPFFFFGLHLFHFCEVFWFLDFNVSLRQ